MATPDNKNLIKLYGKLLAVKKQVPYIKKDKEGFNYTYATPSAVFGTLNPLLNAVGLLLITNVVDSKSYAITVVTKKGPKEEWKFDLKFIFKWVDTETGEELAIPWEASGVNGEDKGLGSALTYAERYFVLKQFNIPTDDDDPDNFQEKHGTEESKETAKNKKADEEKTKLEAAETAIKATTTMDELITAWGALTPDQRKKLQVVKDDQKVKLQTDLNTAAETALRACKDLPCLQTTFTALDKTTKAAVLAVKDEMKITLSKPAT